MPIIKSKSSLNWNENEHGELVFKEKALSRLTINSNFLIVIICTVVGGYIYIYIYICGPCFLGRIMRWLAGQY